VQARQMNQPYKEQTAAHLYFLALQARAVVVAVQPD
jgi:hypothetical protein